MSNETTLDDVLALVAKATPGPFDTGTKAPIGLSTPWDMVATDDGEPVAYCNYGPKDAAAIAAAVNYLRAHGDELRGALEDARRYRWLREHFRFANDSAREIWFDPSLEPNDSGVPVDLDAAIDAAQEVGK